MITALCIKLYGFWHSISYPCKTSGKLIVPFYKIFFGVLACIYILVYIRDDDSFRT